MRDTINPNAPFDVRLSDFLTRLQGLDTDPATTDRALMGRMLDDAADAVRQTADTRLRLIDAALARMIDGTYGFCETCSAPIPLAQLEQNPAICFCAVCAR